MDMSKIILGLEYCMADGVDCYEPSGGKCPYYTENNCVDSLLFDIYDMVKEQVPRVMTIGDLYGNDMGYYERKDEELVWPVLIARGGPDSDGTVGLVRKDAFKIMADCGLINQTWRIWTAYPTNEQRKAVKWDA